MGCRALPCAPLIAVYREEDAWPVALLVGAVQSNLGKLHRKRLHPYVFPRHIDRHTLRSAGRHFCKELRKRNWGRLRRLSPLLFSQSCSSYTHHPDDGSQPTRAVLVAHSSPSAIAGALQPQNSPDSGNVDPAMKARSLSRCWPLEDAAMRTLRMTDTIAPAALGSDDESRRRTRDSTSDSSPA